MVLSPIDSARSLPQRQGDSTLTYKNNNGPSISSIKINRRTQQELKLLVSFLSFSCSLGLLSSIGSIPPTRGFVFEAARTRKCVDGTIPRNQHWMTAYSSSRSSLSATTSSWQEEIQLAIQDSKLGQSSIDAAHTACSRWESILDQKGNQNSDDQSPGSSQQFLPPAIQTLCFAMYASCLVRTGRDDKAIGVYKQALSLLTSQKDPTTARDLLLGKAKAHQRLLQYSDAFNTYSELVDLARNNKISLDISDFIGAVTCSLRLQQPQRAHEILLTACNLLEKEHAQDIGSGKSERFQRDSTQVKIFLSVLNHCMGTETLLKERNNSVVEKWLKPPISSLECDYPLYFWLYDSALLQSYQQGTASIGSENSLEAKSVKHANDAFLALMKINQSPWDDPFLLQLDDKVLLHRLLALNRSGTAIFWPKGYVMPTEREHLTQHGQKECSGDSSSDHQKWIAKARAGYGSHGNQIMSLQEAMKKAGSGNMDGTTQSDEFLLQELIDPTLLINGRKFSLRLYVVYFSPEDFYLSHQGLVKLAAIEATEEMSNQSGDDSARRAFMTNSGREQSMEQHDLRFLKNESELFESETEYASFWSKIEESTKQVMKSYRDHHRNQIEEFPGPEDFESRRRALGIPKILGLDYLVDTKYQAWLLEVNRFPGLEPRDESDRLVKHQIVRDAWLCAHERLMESKGSETTSTSAEHHPLQHLLDHLPPVSNECPYSLKRLN